MAIDWDAPEDESGTGDETGYFHTGDHRALEEEFLRWLRGVAKLVTEGLEEDYQWMMISMAIGHHYHHHGPLVTPMGPRDVPWLEAVAEDPGRGIDLFPWWPAGIGAPFYLGRALARMWRDVRWRAPLTDDEGRLLMDVHLDLARAYRLDASLDYPWREWRELMDSIEAHFGYVEMAGDDLEAEVRRRAAAIGPRRRRCRSIGYRRRPVRVDLTDGWSIEIPGEMAEEWDDEGLWTARDDGRAVFFKSYSLSKDDDSKPAAAGDPRRPDPPRRPIASSTANEDVIGRAVLTSPNGDDDPGGSSSATTSSTAGWPPATSSSATPTSANGRSRPGGRWGTREGPAGHPDPSGPGTQGDSPLQRWIIGHRRLRATRAGRSWGQR